MTYQEVYDCWRTDPEGFWMSASESVDWVRKPSRALFSQNPPFHEWFKDGELNGCWNAVDRHVACGIRRSGGHHPRQSGYRLASDIDLQPTPREGCASCGSARSQGSRNRRSGRHLHANDSEAIIACLACAASEPSTLLSSAVLQQENWPSGSTTANRNACWLRPAE